MKHLIKLQNEINSAWNSRVKDFLNAPDWTLMINPDIRQELKWLWLDHPNNNSFSQFLLNFKNLDL